MFENDAWCIYKSFLVFIYYKWVASFYMLYMCVDLQVTIQYFILTFYVKFFKIILNCTCVLIYGSEECNKYVCNKHIKPSVLWKFRFSWQRVWKWKQSGILYRVVSLKCTVISVMTSETSVNTTILQGEVSQKSVIFIWNLLFFDFAWKCSCATNWKIWLISFRLMHFVPA
jgi:hypothetical protein